MEQEQQLELWKNPGLAQVVIQRVGANGQVRHELISGGRNFSITPADRRMNQNLAANAELDVFANGVLQPVQLLEDTEVGVSENPNHLGGDISGVFRLHYKTFQKRVEEITNPVLLQQLLDMAEEADATIRQVSVIRARLDVVAPPVDRPTDVDATGVPKIKPVTPR